MNDAAKATAVLLLISVGIFLTLTQAIDGWPF